MADPTYILDMSRRLGLWCEICLLPSAAEVDFLRVKDDGVAAVGTVRVCANGPHDDDD